MDSGHAWGRWLAAEYWHRGGPRAVNVYPLEPLISADPVHASGKSTNSGLVTLKTRADFLRVAATRRRAVTPSLVLQAARRPEGSGCVALVRVGFTASRKVGNAVTRNRAKRRLRGLAALVLLQEGEPGTDYVLIARTGTAGRPYATLVADLQAALRRLNRRRLTSRTGAA